MARYLLSCYSQREVRTQAGTAFLTGCGNDGDGIPELCARCGRRTLWNLLMATVLCACVTFGSGLNPEGPGWTPPHLEVELSCLFLMFTHRREVFTSSFFAFQTQQTFCSGHVKRSKCWKPIVNTLQVVRFPGTLKPFSAWTRHTRDGFLFLTLML